MAYRSVWYFTDLPEKVVDLIEEDISEKFDVEMRDSRLHGDALNKEKRNSQNAWIPTSHWCAGFLWHYIQRANRENFLYDLRCIDGESMQYTRYGKGMFYGWHNDAGLSTQYKPVANGNRAEGLGQDFVNENTSSDNYSETTSSLLLKIENILDTRLADLSPEDIKIIIQKMIKEHLGWLVVWGGFFGGFLGLTLSPVGFNIL